jgi:hypothetical protein
MERRANGPKCFISLRPFSNPYASARGQAFSGESTPVLKLLASLPERGTGRTYNSVCSTVSDGPSTGSGAAELIHGNG